MEIPVLQNVGRGGLPDVKRQPGSSCFKSGSWTSNDLIEFLLDTVCTDLKSRALAWKKYPGAKRTIRSSAINVEGFNQNLTF